MVAADIIYDDIDGSMINALRKVLLENQVNPTCVPDVKKSD